MKAFLSKKLNSKMTSIELHLESIAGEALLSNSISIKQNVVFDVANIANEILETSQNSAFIGNSILYKRHNNKTNLDSCEEHGCFVSFN